MTPRSSTGREGACRPEGRQAGPFLPERERSARSSLGLELTRRVFGVEEAKDDFNLARGQVGEANWVVRQMGGANSPYTRRSPLLACGDSSMVERARVRRHRRHVLLLRSSTASGGLCPPGHLPGVAPLMRSFEGF